MGGWDRLSDNKKKFLKSGKKRLAALILENSSNKMKIRTPGQM